MSDSAINTNLLKSELCTQARLSSTEFQAWAVRIGEAPMHLHRKIWEWCYITQALSEHNMLCPQARGLGFAVGTEPLTSLFASFGCQIIATDLFEDAAKQAGWIDTNQHAANHEALNMRGLCPPELFQDRVTFRNVDMNNIPDDLRNFDFIWSSCALEHLGSITQGYHYIYNAMNCLKPGGIAVHTTEFNVSSDTATVDNTDTVLFRRKDIEEIARAITAQGHYIDLDLSEGDGYADKTIDIPPYKHDVHLKLQLGKYVTTSVGLIIRKSTGEANNENRHKITISTSNWKKAKQYWQNLLGISDEHK